MNQPEISVVQSGANRYGVLNALVKSSGLSRLSVLEVGSFEGQSALIWSAAIAQHCSEGGMVLCVDPWSEEYLKKYLGQGAAYNTMAEGLRSGEVYRRFRQNAELADMRVPIRHFQGTLKQAVKILHSNTFDIIYLDGDHALSAVREDIALARELVRVGGLLCGDDLEVQGGDCAWDAAMSIADQYDYIWGYHPGVTIAVWEAFGRVWSQQGVWAVQKTADNAWQPPAGV